ncbi:MAG: COX15/CtaA family protein [Planctomycetales bacterium]|nr:COX15/CtaA family protein [Planctomycetales bacterium]
MNREAVIAGEFYRPVIHRLAVALTVAVFPLIWVGGLVTTYDAGMAVPDWPGTYGWNMFAYPASTWLFGPFDLLVEHSHRLLGALAGFLSIALLIAAIRFERRAWFRWWCVGVLLSVIAQGALGGARVVLDQRTIAMIHGCTGPLFFALATATAVMSSRWWLSQQTETTRNASGFEASRSPMTLAHPWMCRAAGLLVVASYVQLIIGAQLRHVTGALSHREFMAFVHAHLTMAAVVLLLASGLSLTAMLSSRLAGCVRLPAELLFLLVVVQIVLGIGTWIVNYALPWPEINQTLAGYTILSKGYWESLVVTAHMATGSLILSISTVVALRAWRWQRPAEPTAATQSQLGFSK